MSSISLKLAATLVPSFLLVSGIGLATNYVDQEKPATNPKTDAFGDPLPAGAIARLGTRRFQMWTSPHEPIHVAGGKAYLVYRPDFEIWGNGAAYEWIDAETGKVTESWHLPAGLTGLGVSSNGKWALLTNRGSSQFGNVELSFALYLYDLSSKKALKKIESTFDKRLVGAASFVSAVVSTDGKWFATISVTYPRGIVQLWETATAKEIWISPLNQYADRRQYEVLGFTPGDNRLVLIGASPNGSDAGFLLLDPTQKEKTRFFSTAGGSPGHFYQGLDRADVGMSPDGKVVVDGNLVWDLAAGKQLPRLAGHEVFVSSFAFAPDSETLVTASIKEKTALVRDWPSGKARREIDLGRTGVAKLFVSADGKILNALFHSGSTVDRLSARETAIHRYDLESGKQLPMFETHIAEVIAVVAASDGTIRSVGDDLVLRTWDLASSRQTNSTFLADLTSEQIWFGTSSKAANLVLSPDGKQIAFPGPLGKSLLFYGQPTDKLRTINSSAGHSLSFSADNRFLTGSDMAGNLSVWESATGKEVAKFPNESPLADIRYTIPALGSDSRFLAAIYLGQVCLWKVDHWREMQKLSLGDSDHFHATEITFTDDCRMLAVGTWSTESKGGTLGHLSLNWNQVILIEMTTKKIRKKTNIEGIPSTGPRFSPNGRYMAWGTTKATAEVWDIYLGKRVAEFRGHDGPIRAVTFTRDSKQLITASADATLLVWDLQHVKQE